MAGHNYLSDPKNPFFSLEDDVDDETFLRNAPVRSEPAGRYQNFDNDFTQTRQQLLQRKKEIEERTVQSSERSVSLLRDSEQIGVATAEELIRQKEQLQRTEKRLDDINSTLRFSQKHIQGIKSVFGSLKNYLSGKSLDAPIPSTKLSESSSSGSMTSPALSNTLEQVQSNINNSYSSTMIRGSYDDYYLEDVKPAGDRITKVLEQNLSEMSGSLARLKHLAIGLSEEIDSQNDLIDNITDKTEKADIMLQQQNKDMLHLLKK
ncbi:Synaptosomal-associated protein 29 [Trachymyrmex septentrionalis]|uniref:Synaptosomal-associated protein 29 n=1 Tax=Trachymyrmex septentrionalis TaxID=34720 RepID=A0A151JTN5_9HYME|nr:PREDICTED: synaptosomal-associated protein 29 [Trachymyrmex septentrionalis]KYN33999.1 Synaptosomal-associated protein 29 [Trachymyrmex septentrionalis]